jgi:hypothetical protein
MEFYTKFTSIPVVDRQEQSFRLIKRFPDKYPVIIDRASRREPTLDKNKYLVNSHSTVSELMYLLRKKLKVSPTQAVFFFLGNSMVSGNMTIAQLNHASNLKYNDGFTYLFYSLENTFG